MTFQQRPNLALRLATTLVTILLGSSNAHSENLVDSALRFFVGHDCITAGFDLDKSRPQPVPPDFRARVLEVLPKEGRIMRLKEPERKKLDSLSTVLRLHHRESVYEFVVFESAPKPFAFVGLHLRAALLISDVA